MMKLNLKNRILFTLLSVVLILPLLAFCASAEDSEFVEWSMTEDGMILSGDKTYYAYEFPAGGPDIYDEALSLYVYYNELEGDWIEKITGSQYVTATVYAPYRDSEIVFLDIRGEWYLYATPTGKAQMDIFVSGRSSNYFLRSKPYMSASVDSSVVNAMEFARAQTGNKRTEEVVNLQDAYRFDVIVYDSTYTYAYTVGAVYRLEDGRDYYLHFLSLGNQHFDAEGNFSYRSGSVELTLLDEKISTELDDVEERIVGRYTDYTYEGDVDLIISKPAFWVLYVLVIMGAPVVFLFVGLAMARSKKRGYPKYWYILSLIAALWIFLAILLMILLI